MSYRLSTPVKPLVWVEASVESHRGSRVEYMVKVRGQFKRRSTANNVEIYVPVPDDADSPKFRVSPVIDPRSPQASTGSVVYAPEKSAFVWKIKQLGGGRDYLMRAHFGLPSVRNGELSALNSSSRRGARQASAYIGQIRDPLLHRLWNTGTSSGKSELTFYRSDTSKLSKRVDMPPSLG